MRSRVLAVKIPKRGKRNKKQANTLTYQKD